MARRIETLEGEIDGARERASKSAAVLRSETDRWAAVEADLKKQIKELELRIRKYKKKKDAST
jgi:phage shock protein A